MQTFHRRTLAAAAAASVLAFVLTACGSSSMSGMDGMGHSPTAATSATTGMPGMPGMPGMGGTGGMATDGLAAEQDGYRLNLLTTGAPGAELRFTVSGPDGRPVTAFTPEQTKLMHFYAVRSDLSGFQHVHPTMGSDGTWTAPLAPMQPGAYRVYASFSPAAASGGALVLSRPLTVPGDATPTPLPPAASSTTVDGYTVTVDGSPAAGAATELKVTVSKDGRPVTDLQPYLETYAHLTAFHEGDQAFAHLHPETAPTGGGTGGPALAFHAELPRPGNWRLFLQFQTAGTLHTAALTLRAS